MSTSSDWYQQDGSLLTAVRESGWSATPEPEIPGYAGLCELRRGGQGIVYTATQLSTKRKVAIKVLIAGAWASRRHLRRFEREIDLVAGLQHPHIVRLYDRGLTDQGHPYYVMEFIDGLGLDELIDAKHASPRVESKPECRSMRRLAAPRIGNTTPLAVRSMLDLLAKICEAVDYAHRHGVIHRDIKPSNIRIDTDGEPHVLDFGLAKQVLDGQLESSAPVSHTGEFMGSLPWSSPEQTDGVPDRIDVRSDVYSLGVVLFQCLTREFPYAVTGGFRQTLTNIQTAEPRRPSSVRPDLDEELDTIVLKCLAKEPERRYQSAAELADDLRRYLAGEPIQARGDSVTYRLRKRLRRHRVTVALAAALVIVVASAAGLLRGALSQRGSPRAPEGSPHLLDVVDEVSETKWGTTFFANSLAGLTDRATIPGNLALGHDGQAGTHTVGAGQVLEATKAVFVGFDADAVLDIVHGGLVRSETATIGQMQGAAGRVTLAGADSSWVVERALYVGSFGYGELEIRSGASVHDEDGRIGQNPGGSGIAVVDGEGTEWRHSQSFVVGNHGPADVRIQNGAKVSCVHAGIGDQVGAEGTVVIADGNATWQIRSSLCVGGWPGMAGGCGSVTIERDAAVYVGHTLRLWPDGTVHVAGGMLCADTVDATTGGALELAGGGLCVNTFDGDLLNEGAWLGPAYSPGTVEVNGDYVQTGGTLELRIHGARPGEYDRLIVTGSATFDGALNVILAEGFVPEYGDEVTIVTADAIFGAFANAEPRLGIAGGGTCEMVYGDRDVRLTHFEGPFHSDPSFVDAQPHGPLPKPALAAGPFPRRLAMNATPHHDLIFLGPPDDIIEGVAGQIVDYDFGEQRIVDGEGPDLVVYEGDYGNAEFNTVDVLVSEDGVHFVSIRESRSAPVRILGDEAHDLGPYAASYDLAGSGLHAVRYIRIDGHGDAQVVFSNHGFDLDAIGAIHLATAGDAPTD